MVTAADADAVDVAVTGWLADRDPAPAEGVHVDGKTQRGAIDADGDQVHLLAAVTDTGVVLAQDDVAAKTNEITGFAPLLDRLRVAGRTVTADALHTQRGHAEYQHGRNAKFVFCVKGNQPRLFDAPDVLPWETTPTGHESTERGHGRFTRRTICVLPAPEDLPFPHINQVFLIERYVSDLRGERLSAVAVLGVTSLTAAKVGPARIADHVRDHWNPKSCTGSATPSTAKTTPRPAPGQDPVSQPPCATWPPGRCTWPDGATPPKPPDGPTADRNARSPSLDSQNDCWNGPARCVRFGRVRRLAIRKRCEPCSSEGGLFVVLVSSDSPDQLKNGQLTR
ncbi:putative transposase YbfD/YdcC [Catenulispora sp. MAP5-51]